MSLYSRNVYVLSNGRNALSQQHRTLWHQTQRVFLVGNVVHSNTAPLVWCTLVEVGHAWFSFAKHSSRLVLTNVCSNEQLVEGQTTKYFIISVVSSTNNRTLFVFRKVTGDVYGCKTLFYILFFIQFALIQNGCQYVHNLLL